MCYSTCGDSQLIGLNSCSLSEANLIRGDTQQFHQASKIHVTMYNILFSSKVTRSGIAEEHESR